MKAFSNNSKIQPRSNLIRFGLCFAIAYYIADSAMDAFLFNEGPLLDQIISPNKHELAIRLLTCAFLMIFALTAKIMFTKNQLLQHKLLHQTQTLLAAEKERDAFTHSYSHDLRTTLTCIYSAEQIITDMYNQDLGEDVQNLINHIDESCQRMSAQIDNMLGLSHALRAKINIQRIELRQLINEVTHELLCGRESMDISVEMDGEQMADCDPELIRLAIRNMCFSVERLCNPNDFSGITIGNEISDGERMFYVRNNKAQNFNSHDNLVDIPDQGMTSEGSSNNYICLALIKTVFQRHGGQVLTEISPRAGSIFYFRFCN